MTCSLAAMYKTLSGLVQGETDVLIIDADMCEWVKHISRLHGSSVADERKLVKMRGNLGRHVKNKQCDVRLRNM